MAKRVPPLSALQVAKLKPDPGKTIELVDGAVPGLRLRLSPTGTRTWSLNLRAKGVMRRFEVGSGLGLSEARTKAEVLRIQVKEGFDPTEKRREERTRSVHAKAGIGTLESVMKFYFEHGPGQGLKTGSEQLARVRSVFARKLNRPAEEVTSKELQLVIDAHPAKTSAARAASYLVPVIKWAKKRGLMVGQFDLELPLLPAPSQRVLSVEELRALLPLFADPYGRCCLFMLLTAARRDEARFATWGQFDLAEAKWTIPGDVRKDTRPQGRRRRKPKVSLEIPLSPQAVKLLGEVRDIEIQRRAALEIDDEIVDEDHVFVGNQGGHLKNWNRWLKSIAELTGIAGMSPHALRRTAATLAGDAGTPPHVVSIMLGHANVGGNLIAGYNHSRYPTEHREALDKLGQMIDDIRNLSDDSQLADS